MQKNIITKRKSLLERNNKIKKERQIQIWQQQQIINKNNNKLYNMNLIHFYCFSREEQFKVIWKRKCLINFKQEYHYYSFRERNQIAFLGKKRGGNPSEGDNAPLAGAVFLILYIDWC